eukprot:g4203.t1
MITYLKRQPVRQGQNTGQYGTQMDTTKLQKMRMDGELALGMRAENERMAQGAAVSPTKNVMINGKANAVVDEYAMVLKVQEEISKQEELARKQAEVEQKRAILQGITNQIEQQKQRKKIKEMEKLQDLARVKENNRKFAVEDAQNRQALLLKRQRDKEQQEHYALLFKQAKDKELQEKRALEMQIIERAKREEESAKQLIQNQKEMWKQIAEDVKISNERNRQLKLAQKQREFEEDIRLAHEYEERLMKEDRARKAAMEKTKRAINSNEAAAAEIARKVKEREIQENIRIEQVRQERQELEHRKFLERQARRQQANKDQMDSLAQQIQRRKERKEHLILEDRARAREEHLRFEQEVRQDELKRLQEKERQRQYRMEVLHQQELDRQRKLGTAGAMTDQERKLNAPFLILYDQMQKQQGGHANRSTFQSAARNNLNTKPF